MRKPALVALVAALLLTGVMASAAGRGVKSDAYVVTAMSSGYPHTESLWPSMITTVYGCGFEPGKDVVLRDRVYYMLPAFAMLPADLDTSKVGTYETAEYSVGLAGPDGCIAPWTMLIWGTGWHTLKAYQGPSNKPKSVNHYDAEPHHGLESGYYADAEELYLYYHLPPDGPYLRPCPLCAPRFLGIP